MNENAVDNLLRELRDELTVTPSAEFAARVRARIADGQVRSWKLKFWIPAGAVAAAGLVIAIAPWQSNDGAPTRAGNLTRVSVPAVAPPDNAVARPVAPVPTPLAPSRRTTAPRVAVQPKPALDLQVLTTQPAVLRKIRMDLVKNNAALDDSAEASAPVSADPESALVVSPLAVEPIAVSGIGRQGGGGSGPAPAVRRVVVEDSNRSQE